MQIYWENKYHIFCNVHLTIWISLLLYYKSCFIFYLLLLTKVFRELFMFSSLFAPLPVFLLFPIGNPLYFSIIKHCWGDGLPVWKISLKCLLPRVLYICKHWLHMWMLILFSELSNVCKTCTGQWHLWKILYGITH